jgi:hypothetical protein
MTSVPLRLGRLTAVGYEIRRSGIRWLREDGQVCRAGDIIAYCSIGLVPIGAPPPHLVFADESPDLQVAFATQLDGRLRIAPDASRGGFLDQLQAFWTWTDDFVIGHLERDPSRPAQSEDQIELRLIMTAGQRPTEIAAERTGLLTGWFERRRGWRADSDGALGTLLSLGICEQAGIIRGERGAFHELFQATPGRVHVIHVPDQMLVPTTAVLVDQLGRTKAQNAEIAADLARSFLGGPAVPTARDWLFAGVLLSALQSSPLTEACDILTRHGLQRAARVDAVVLSVLAEPTAVLRHRRLGYLVALHDFRLARAGNAAKAWLRANFEPVPRSLDDIRRDCSELIRAVRARQPTEFLVLNAMSTISYEQIDNYASFDLPLSDTVATVRAKELNLLLCDLAREHDISIIDADLIGASLGVLHLPDAVHQSGTMQAELRNEILHTLRVRGVPGFAAPTTRRQEPRPVPGQSMTVM